MNQEYLNGLYNIDAQASHLLGSFNSDGNYTISDDIKEELLKAKKVITDYMQDKITAVATVGSYTYNFVIYRQDGEENKVRAALFLVEKGNLGFISKEMVTGISSIVLEKTPQTFEQIKKTFNLFLRDDSEGIDLSNSNLTKLLKKVTDDDKLFKYLISALKDKDREYVLKMLSYVKMSGEYGTKLYQEFQNQIKSFKFDSKDEKYWFKLKLMLDMLLIENNALFNGKIAQRMEELQKEYLSNRLSTKIPVAAPKNVTSKSAGGDDKKKDKAKDKKKDDKKKDDKKKDDKKKDDKAKKSDSDSKKPKDEKSNNKLARNPRPAKQFKPPITQTKPTKPQNSNEQGSSLGELMGSINGKDLFHLKNRIKNQSAEPHKEADGGMER